MSQRAIVELNLDYFHEIELNPEQFVRLLTRAVLHRDDASQTIAREDRDRLVAALETAEKIKKVHETGQEAVLIPRGGRK